MPRAHCKGYLRYLSWPARSSFSPPPRERTHFQPQHGPSPALPELDKQTSRVVNRAPGPVGHYVPIDDDELKP